MLDPDLEAFLELVAAGGGQPMHLAGPARARASYDAATLAIDAPGAELARVRELRVPVRDGAEVGARLYESRPDTGQPVLLFFHGGGYCVGGLDSHDSLCRDLADQAGCAVLALDYRLAPEHRFPTAFHDAVDAWQWLRGHAAALGLDPARLAVGGDSAGGTLATALCLHAREAGAPAPCLQLLLYPCTSAHADFPSRVRYAEGFLLEAATLDWMYGNYLGAQGDARDWRFSPLSHPDLAGLPPAHVALAEHDLLVDEGRAYAQRLADAGVPVRLEVYEGMTHDFARLGNIVTRTATLRRDLAQALRAAFADRPVAA